MAIDIGALINTGIGIVIDSGTNIITSIGKAFAGQPFVVGLLVIVLIYIWITKWGK